MSNIRNGFPDRFSDLNIKDQIEFIRHTFLSNDPEMKPVCDFYDLIDKNNFSVFKTLFTVKDIIASNLGSEVVRKIFFPQKSHLTSLQRFQLLNKFVPEFSELRELREFLSEAEIDLFALAQENEEIAYGILKNELLSAVLSPQQWNVLYEKFPSSENQFADKTRVNYVRNLEFLTKDVVDIIGYIQKNIKIKMSEIKNLPNKLKKYQDIYLQFEAHLDLLKVMPALSLNEFVEKFRNIAGDIDIILKMMISKNDTFDQQFIIPWLKQLSAIANYLERVHMKIPESYSAYESSGDSLAYDHFSFCQHHRTFLSEDAYPNINAEMPKRLHYVWVGGELPQKYIENILQIGFHMPGYQINIWTDNLDVLKKARVHFEQAGNIHVHSMSEFIDLIKKNCTSRASELLINMLLREGVGALNFASKSDIMRIIILYLKGGLYLDTDIAYVADKNDILKVIDNMLNDRMDEKLNDMCKAFLDKKLLRSFFRMALEYQDYRKNINEEFHRSLMNDVKKIDYLLGLISTFKNDSQSQLAKEGASILEKINELIVMLQQIRNEIIIIARKQYSIELDSSVDENSANSNVISAALREAKMFPGSFVLPFGFKHSEQNNCVMAATKFHPILHDAINQAITNYKLFDLTASHRQGKYYVNAMDLKRGPLRLRYTIDKAAGPGVIVCAVAKYLKTSVSSEQLASSSKYLRFDPFTFSKADIGRKRGEQRIVGILGILGVFFDNTWLVNDGGKKKVKSFDDAKAIGLPQTDVFKPKKR